MFVSKIAEKEARGEEWEKPESFFMMIYQYVLIFFFHFLESVCFSLSGSKMDVVFLPIGTAITNTHPQWGAYSAQELPPISYQIYPQVGYTPFRRYPL